MALIFRSADNSDSRVFDCGECEPQLNLLAHAQLIELGLGSECGGHGKCGKDRVLVPSESANGFSQLTEAERKHLSVEEIGAGMRLACQCFPESPGQSVVIRAQSLKAAPTV